LITLFQVEQAMYNTAVEVAAGGQLMHVVVEDDECASRLMEELLKRRLGRLARPFSAEGSGTDAGLQGGSRSSR
jgi:chromosome segregation ATPase